MEECWIRTASVLGEEAIDKLKSSCVAVFGVGGVGSYAVEALARSGVGRLILVDHDTVSVSNINRQLIATCSTVGLGKCDVASLRIHDINPSCTVETHKLFFNEETASGIDFSGVDYIVDAIDSVPSKLLLARTGQELGIPVISSMGTGNKLDPTKLEVADIYETSMCPLARAVRHECRVMGIKKLKVVYSKEEPVKTGERTPGSVPWVPAACGLIIAGEVIKDLIK